MKQENQFSEFELNLKNQPPVPLWMFVVAYLIPWSLLAAIALFWPADHAFLGLDFTQSSLARMVPSISAYIDKSPFPHATAAYFVLSGVFVLPLSYLALRNRLLVFFTADRMLRFYWQYKISRSRSWLAFVFSVPLALWIFWFQPGYQYGLMPINDARWALALFGPLFSFYCMIGYFGVAVRAMFNFEQLLISERRSYGVE